MTNLNPGPVKMVIILLCGLIFVSIIALGTVLSNPKVAQSDDPETLPDIAVTYQEALSLSLQLAGEEFLNTEIGSFYQSLLHETELDKPNNDATLSEKMSDIKKVSHSALTFPLQEVQKDIQDKEIAKFYGELLNKVLMTPESN